MDERDHLLPPGAVQHIYDESRLMGFTMVSEPLSGSLLRTLAASKRGGRLLELGTGTGAATAWILDGMDASASLTTVENDPKLLTVARKYHGLDPRVTFVASDAAEFLKASQRLRFDFIFADTWVGKFDELELAINLLDRGGLYIIDDMNPQSSWPPDHLPKVARLIAQLEGNADLAITKLNWATGIVIAARVRPTRPGSR